MVNQSQSRLVAIRGELYLLIRNRFKLQPSTSWERGRGERDYYIV